MKKAIILIITTACTLGLFGQGTVQLSSGTTAKPTGGVYLVFNNMNLVNNGTLQQSPGDGTLKFTGASDVSVSGSGATIIDSLLLAKGNTVNLNLQSDISVASQVNFAGGLFNLGNNAVDLGSTGMLANESETSRAYTSGTGSIQSTQILNAPSSVNAGNLGAVITSSANLGSTVIKRGFTSNGNITGSKSILRYYVITPTNNTGLNATFRFEYLDSELNGLTESTLEFWRSADSVSWTDIGATTRDSITNYVEKTGLNDFSFWTLAPHFSALPITLSTFGAFKNGTGIEVTWKVLTSLNLSRYEVEKSADGNNFNTIGEQPSTAASDYAYFDGQPLQGNNYYRLRMVDLDGSITYSSIVKVNVDSKIRQVNFYPNPVVNNTVILQLINLAKGNYKLQLFNNAGQQVYISMIAHSGGSSNQTINFPRVVSSGIYHVRLSNDTESFNGSLLIR